MKFDWECAFLFLAISACIVSLIAIIPLLAFKCFKLAAACCVVFLVSVFVMGGCA